MPADRRLCNTAVAAHSTPLSPVYKPCDCAACEGFRSAHPATVKAWTWLSREWHDLEPERRERIAEKLGEVDATFKQWDAEHAQ